MCSNEAAQSSSPSTNIPSPTAASPGSKQPHTYLHPPTEEKGQNNNQEHHKKGQNVTQPNKPQSTAPSVRAAGLSRQNPSKTKQLFCRHQADSTAGYREPTWWAAFQHRHPSCRRHVALLAGRPRAHSRL